MEHWRSIKEISDKAFDLAIDRFIALKVQKFG